MKIAVDAMGGDNAPGAIVEGAVLAAREFNSEILLVGKKDIIAGELAKYDTKGLSLDIVDAEQVVQMDESPSMVLRRKRKSSLFVCAMQVKEKQAATMLSAGNTGATMACAMFTLGVLKGVERPAIATILPSLSGHSLLLDAGANVDCKPFHLLQFATMGQVYAQHVMGINEPRVGLLNIGHEPGKGNELTKQAYELLAQAPINFAGNVEGKHIYNGEADVIVCDGFIGNVALKVSEAVAGTITTLFKQEIKKSILNKLAALLLKKSLLNMKRRIDYSEYGGAPLLGLNGGCIICHGSSGAKAIKNGIRAAGEFIAHNVNEHIEEKIVHRSKFAQIWGNISKRKP